VKAPLQQSHSNHVRLVAQTIGANE